MLDTDIPNGPPVPTLDDYSVAFAALAQRERLAAAPDRRQQLGMQNMGMGRAGSQHAANLHAMLGQDVSAAFPRSWAGSKKDKSSAREKLARFRQMPRP